MAIKYNGINFRNQEEVNEYIWQESDSWPLLDVIEPEEGQAFMEEVLKELAD